MTTVDTEFSTMLSELIEAWEGHARTRSHRQGRAGEDESFIDEFPDYDFEAKCAILADRSGLTENQLEQVLYDGKIPDDEIIVAIANALGLEDSEELLATAKRERQGDNALEIVVVEKREGINRVHNTHNRRSGSMFFGPHERMLGYWAGETSTTLHRGGADPADLAADEDEMIPSEMGGDEDVPSLEGRATPMAEQLLQCTSIPQFLRTIKDRTRSFYIANLVDSNTLTAFVNQYQENVERIKCKRRFAAELADEKLVNAEGRGRAAWPLYAFVDAIAKTLNEKGCFENPGVQAKYWELALRDMQNLEEIVDAGTEVYGTADSIKKALENYGFDKSARVAVMQRVAKKVSETAISLEGDSKNGCDPSEKQEFRVGAAGRFTARLMEEGVRGQQSSR